jgi:hypothetical protein
MYRHKLQNQTRKQQHEKMSRQWASFDDSFSVNLTDMTTFVRSKRCSFHRKKCCILKYIVRLKLDVLFYINMQYT